MKTSRFLALIVVAGLFASCTDQDIQMRTTIHRDGTCQRVITFVADSAALVGSHDSSLPLAQLLSDSGWHKNCFAKRDTARLPYPMTPEQYGRFKASHSGKSTSDTLLVCIERDFGSVEEMGAATVFQPEGIPLMPQTSLTRRFRWFYTYYTYQESYPVQSQLFVYPLSKFMDDSVASYWFTGEPDLMQGYSPAEKKETYDMLEEQFDRWLVANYVAATYEAIVFEGAGEMHDSPTGLSLDENAYQANLDSLVNYALDRQFTFGDDIDSLFSSYFGCGVCVPAFASDQVEQQLERGLNAFMELMSLKVDYRLVLPGKVVDAGNGIMEEGAVRYRLTGSRLIPHDYTLTATSRADNVWAFVVAALVILVAAAILLTPLMKRRN